MTAETETPHLDDFLEKSPTNWGKWTPDGEVGSLDHCLSTAPPRPAVGGLAASVHPVVR